GLVAHPAPAPDADVPVGNRPDRHHHAGGAAGCGGDVHVRGNLDDPVAQRPAARPGPARRPSPARTAPPGIPGGAMSLLPPGRRRYLLVLVVACVGVLVLAISASRDGMT